MTFAEDRPFRHFRLALIAVAYTLIVYYGSLVPLRFTSIEFADAMDRLRNLPWLDIDVYGRADLVANCLLFIPVGFFWCGTFVRGRRRVFGLGMLCFAASIGLVIGVAIEFIQFWFPPRTSSLNDALAQTVGVALGMVVWLCLGERSIGWLRKLGADSSLSIDWILQAYLLGYVIHSLLPLDVVISADELQIKFSEGRILFVPFQFGAATRFHMFLKIVAGTCIQIPVGILFYRFSCRRSYRHAWLASIALSVFTASVIEVCQLFIFTRYFDTTAIFYATIGGCLGAGIAWLGYEYSKCVRFPNGLNQIASVVAWSLSKRSFVFYSIVSYAGCLFACYWFPFDFKTTAELHSIDLSPFLSPPFTALYWGSEFNAVNQILFWLATYTPMGAMIILLFSSDLRKSKNRLCLFTSSAVSFFIAVVIELGQLLLPSRVADSTQIIVSTAGGFLGAKMALYLSTAILRSPDTPGPVFHVARRHPPLPWNSLLLTASVILIIGMVSWTLYVGILPRENETDQVVEGRFRVENRFGRTPENPWTAPLLTPLPLRLGEGLNAIWGSVGRDHEGNIWFGVSSNPRPSATAALIQFEPKQGVFLERGRAIPKLAQVRSVVEGESQAKIHTRIQQADDGKLYFASMDETGESTDGSKLPIFGSHLWRLSPLTFEWEHLLNVPEGVIACSGHGRFVYFLGYFGHVVIQYDTQLDRFNRVTVGSFGGHVSRNFLTDVNEHVYVPRIAQSLDTKEGNTSTAMFVELVELDTSLREVGKARLNHYTITPDDDSHGITGFVEMADNSIVFTTNEGFLYRVVPNSVASMRVESIGWIHPLGESYASSMFTYSGERLICALVQRTNSPWEWIVYDINDRTGKVFRVDMPAELVKNSVFYGSNIQDDAGHFYLVGSSNNRPVILQVGPSRDSTLTDNSVKEPEDAVVIRLLTEGTGKDWLVASQAVRMNASRTLAIWLHGPDFSDSSLPGIYYEKIQAFAGDNRYSEGRISEWVPLIYGDIEKNRP